MRKIKEKFSKEGGAGLRIHSRTVSHYIVTAGLTWFVNITSH